MGGLIPAPPPHRGGEGGAAGGGRPIQAAAEEWRSASGDFGWQVVEAMWGLTAEGLDHAALSYLEMKPRPEGRP